MFEITHDSSLWWWPWVFVPLAQGLIATVILLLTRNMGPTTKIVRLLVFLYACLLMVLVGYNLRIRRHYVEAYRNGEYKVVEGRVEHYSWKGKTECFSVRAVVFCRGTGNPDQLAWPIGLTQEGSAVRIAYSDIDSFPKILRLEIGHNSR